MTLTQYKQRMAEMGIDRENLEARIKPFYAVSKQAAYLPGGEKRSLVPLVPVEGQDFSAMNGKAWKVAQRNGRKARRKIL